MRMGAYRRGKHVVPGVLAIVAAFAQPLGAQGGVTVRRPVQPAPRAALERSRLEPAKSVLKSLVGTWRFEMWFAGNFDGAPDASGTRVVSTLFDDLRLEWVEELDHSPRRGQGILGFDATSDRFFSAAVYSGGSAPEFMTGILDDGEPRITFSPLPVSPGATAGQQFMRSSTLNVLDQDHFTVAALDRGWRAVFTRQQ